MRAWDLVCRSAAVGVAGHEEAGSIILVTVPRFYVRTAPVIRPAPDVSESGIDKITAVAGT